jgi:hypothetical protein
MGSRERKKQGTLKKSAEKGGAPAHLPEVMEIKQKIRQYDTVLLFIACFCIFNMVSLVTITSSDVAPATFLPGALILNQNFYFDFASPLTQDPVLTYAFLYQNGHYLSLFPIVTPVLVTPVYLFSYILCNVFNLPLQPEDFIVLGKTSAAIITSLATVIFYSAAKELFSRRTALMAAGIFAFATPTWSISSQALWQTGMVELLLIAMIWIIIRDAKNPSWKNIVIIGILSGLFFFNRPPDSLLLIPVIAYVGLYHRDRIVHYCAGAFAGGFPFLLYNLTYFGNFFGGYKENLGMFFLSPEIFFNFLGLLFGPNVGIIFFAPVVVLSVAGFSWLRDVQDATIQKILFFFGPVVLLHILLYSSYNQWFSASGFCYGPRFLTGIVPVLCLFIGIFLARISTWDTSDWRTLLVKGVTILLVIISVTIQVIGVLFFPYSPDKTASAEKTWDLSHSLIIESYVAGTQEIDRITLYTLPPLPPLFTWTFDRTGGT